MSVTIDSNTLDYNKLRDEMDKMNDMLKKKEAEKTSTSTTTTTTTTADNQVKNLQSIQNTIKWSIIIMVIIIVVVIIIIIIYKVVTRKKSVYIYDNYEQPPQQPIYRVQPPPPQPVYKVVQPPPQQQPIYKVFQQPPPPQQPVYRVQPPPQQQPLPQKQVYTTSTDNSEFTTDSTIWSSSDQTPKKINGGRKFKR